MTRLTHKQKALLDELFKEFKGDAKELFGKHNLIKQINKHTYESALECEMNDHLGYAPHEHSGRNSGKTL